MLNIISLRTMLWLHTDHRCMLETFILFGMFITTLGCDISYKDVSHCPKNTQFITCRHEDALPEEALYQDGGGLCSSVEVNKVTYSPNSDWTVKLSCENDWYTLTLKKHNFSQWDIVVLTGPPDDFSCERSKAEAERGFFHYIHNCFNTSHRSVRLTQRKLKDVCGEEFFRKDKIFIVIVGEEISCLLPEISIPIPVLDSNETAGPEQAAKLLGSLTSLLEKMENSATAAITAGNVTGVVAKLPPKNQTRMSMGRSPSGDVAVLQGNATLPPVYSQTVQLPEETSRKAVERNGSLAAVLFFPGMQLRDNSSTYLQDAVVGIEMGARISNLTEPIRIVFNGVQKNGNNFSCRSWNGEGGAPVWVTDGCETLEANRSVTCLCSHLTFFAVLVSPPPTLRESDLTSLTVVTSVGCGLSLFFQVVALCMHCLIRKRKSNLETKILIQLFVAMFTLNLSFLVNEAVANLGHAAACVTVAAVLHYGLLATFSWFFVQALHLLIKFHSMHSEIRHYVKKVYVAGWVTPALVVLILLSLQKYGLLHIATDEGGKVNMCWIADAAVHQGVNIGYYSVVFVFTLSIFIITVRQIALFKSKSGLNSGKSSTGMKVSSVVALFLLLGLTWAVAFFSHGPLMLPFYYIFTTLNAFQGFLLFIYYYKSSKVFGDDINRASSSSSSTTTKTEVHVMSDVSVRESAVTSKSSK
ncbi:adhesion G-protein coupled receptor G5-like [Salarias fasciatus]|uniref:Adhesion G-protein coupled receptor G5-like n=1 Tax=Salarias fasciatus TaxID=181472 RepID=A0A672HF91_SALFA|nr:adhesion G-protein coupled receptor G5-like [Salarias fasciatus]